MTLPLDNFDTNNIILVGGGAATPCCTTSAHTHSPSRQYWCRSWSNMGNMHSSWRPMRSSGPIPLCCGCPGPSWGPGGWPDIGSVWSQRLNTSFTYYHSIITSSTSMVRAFKYQIRSFSVATKTCRCLRLISYVRACPSMGTQASFQRSGQYPRIRTKGWVKPTHRPPPPLSAWPVIGYVWHWRLNTPVTYHHSLMVSNNSRIGDFKSPSRCSGVAIILMVVRKKIEGKCEGKSSQKIWFEVV